MLNLEKICKPPVKPNDQKQVEVVGKEQVYVDDSFKNETQSFLTITQKNSAIKHSVEIGLSSIKKGALDLQ